MKALRHSRAYAPLWTLFVGTLVAGAVAIGHTWGDALIAEVITVVWSAAWFIVTGRDSDVGAIYGQRSDERQRLVIMSASRLAMVMMFLAAFVCALIAVARNAAYWQSDAVVSVGGVSYLLGIRKYGVHDERTSTGYHGIMGGGSSSEEVESSAEGGIDASRNSESARGDR